MATPLRMLFTHAPQYALGFGQGERTVPGQEDAGSLISSGDSDPNPTSLGAR